MRRLSKNKRGVTPVLSNILLTVIAVAAMSLAASATYVITENMRQVMGERVVVEDVWFASGRICIYLRNVGKTAVKVSSVYLNFTSQSFGEFELEVQEHGHLNVTFDWTPGGLYHMNIVTSRGTSIAGHYKAPM